MTLQRAVIAFLFLTAMTGSSLAGDKWVGEFVIPVKPTSDIRFSGVVGKKEIVLPFTGDWPFKVSAEEEGRLRIHDGRREGWVPKKYFVLTRDAFDYFQDRVDSDSKDSWALFVLGTIAFFQGKHDDAVKRLDNCLKVAPEFVDAYINRALAWRAQEEYERALKDLNEAIRLAPKRGAAYRHRGTLWFLKADKKKQDAKFLANALRDFDEAIRLDPDDVDAYCSRGLVRMERKDQADALKDFDEMVRLAPKSANVLLIRGSALKEMKKFDRALKDLDEAVRLAPKESRALTSRGDLLHAMKEYDRAIRDFDALIEIDAENASAYTQRGFAKAAKKELAAALADYDQALRLSPVDSWAGLNRPVTLMLLRKAGAEDFRKFVKVHGWKDRLSPYAVIFGTFAARQSDDEEGARRFLADAGDKFNGAWPGPVLKFLRGESDAKALLALAKTNGEQTEARCYLGMHSALAGKKDDAIAYFRWVLEQGEPGFVEYVVAHVELDRLVALKEKR